MLAIAILLVELCCGQTDKQTDSKILPTPTDIVGAGNNMRRMIAAYTGELTAIVG